jgi:hypothetical protein
LALIHQSLVQEIERRNATRLEHQMGRVVGSVLGQQDGEDLVAVQLREGCFACDPDRLTVWGRTPVVAVNAPPGVAVSTPKHPVSLR